ncbi:helix-turn-helix domain-containing protein [Paenibacillus cremeus]|uniref:Helix-turn-helix domain-containing protein n=1 Tax=Paenibacillus cremeus TaxID=2163881 RepID=A0A559K9U1_9BACL|nr:helix-turn-helix domain-containing protein [Paenibacillus cremeus]TVY08886.1 helix-turn-helix domain-containing protein [Paenibacillus cremeus]
MPNEIRFHHAGDVTVKAGYVLPERRITDYELVYFPSGTPTVYTVENTPHVLTLPCVIVTRPGELHSYQFDPKRPTRHLYIHFDCHQDTVRERFSLLHSSAVSSVILQEYSLVPMLMKQLLFYFHRRPEQWKRLSESLFLALLDELEQLIQPDARLSSEMTLPMQIDHAMQYIDDHLSEPLDILELAQNVGWSHEHFTRMFQHHTGFSPKKWIIKRRLDLAGQLLLRRTDSIKEIAREVGFTDEYYFHRLFTQRMGMTATEYRKTYGDKRMHELAPPEAHGRFYPLNHSFTLEQREKK